MKGSETMRDTETKPDAIAAALDKLDTLTGTDRGTLFPYIHGPGVSAARTQHAIEREALALIRVALEGDDDQNSLLFGGRPSTALSIAVRKFTDRALALIARDKAGA
jgi:hypothetical protein